MSTGELGNRLTYFESIHRQISDERLDRYVSAAGQGSSIGRLSHIGDESLATILDEFNISDGSRVLDLGSGRGFLARWFQWRKMNVDYTGLDSSPTAIAAARRAAPRARFILHDFLRPIELGEFDMVCAIEATGDGYVTERVAATMLKYLKPSGVALATIVSLKRPYGEAVGKSIGAFAASGGKSRAIDLTAEHTEYVSRLCRLVLEDESGPDDLRRRSHEECSTFLESIRAGTYGYGIIAATK